MKEVFSKVRALVPLFFSGFLIADSAEHQTSTNNINFIDKISITADKNNQLLGASSIRYDAANQRFIILSDDTGAYTNIFGESGKARYYTFPLADIWSAEKQSLRDNLSSIKPALQMHTILAGKYAPSEKSGELPVPPLKDLSKGKVDIEGVTTFHNNELLIVSENGVWEWSAYPSLLRVGADSRLKGYYTFPDRYTNDQPWYRTLAHHPYPYKDAYGKGVKRNKGIESIDRIDGTNEYIAIVEAPLIQDERDWDQSKGMAPVRVLHFSMDEIIEKNDGTGVIDLLSEYFYAFEPLPEKLTRNVLATYPRKSIADVEVIDSKYAVVLEKSYIRYNRLAPVSSKSVTELYLVELGSSYSFVNAEDFYPHIIERKKFKTLKKTLLMRSTELEDQIPELSRLNIEGVTLGPELVDGSRLLVLINDNDAYSAEADSSWDSPTTKFRALMYSMKSVVPAYFWNEGGLFSSELKKNKEPTHLFFFTIPSEMLGEAAFKR